MKLQSRWLMMAMAVDGLLVAGRAATVQEPVKYVVRTASGRVSGLQSPGSKIVSFKGIPFAAPPVGDLRWRAPQPVKPWAGIRKADTFSASCMQHTPEQLLPWTPEFMTHLRVSEDCLYLNVWTPRISPRADLPVVVFIHGGAFNSGAGSILIYNGAHLAETGLVVVTINYRLGVFGFLAYPGLSAESEHHSSGNYGLLDQMAALDWVRKNIRAFGGDPHRVMIWGQSAGAMSVEALTLSPIAVGLFDRAQADSGIGMSGFPLPDLHAAEASGVKYAEQIGAHSLKELRAMPASKLMPPATDSVFHFGPDIDGWVLPASLEKLTASGAGSDVPLVTGYEANDWMLGAPQIHTVEAYKVWAQRLYGDLADEFLRLYPAANTEQVEAMEKISCEDRDRVSMFLWAESRSVHTHQPIYTYYFDRAIPWPQHPEYGAFHSGELPYFFRNLSLMNRPWEALDRKISDEVSTYLKNFAATGDVNGEGLAHWPSYEAGSAVTMQLGEHMGPMPLAEPARLAFWKKYFASPEAAHAPIF